MKSALRRKDQPVRLHSGELGLSDWLHFSWFYPEGFHGEELIETERSWLVLGNGIAYKFLKSRDRPGTPARDRWLRSCRELIDNAPLASPVYLGLRCLNQEEGQLLWESRARSAEVKPHRMPKNVHDVALVMRRMHREDRLDNLLRSRSVSIPSFVSRIASRIASFHSARVEEQRADVLPTADQFLTLSEERYLGTLRSFLLRSESVVDRLSARGLEELLNHLSRFLTSALPHFRNRLRGGFVHDCHRNVNAETIFLLRDELNDEPSPILIARQPYDSGVRIDDCLFDVASLAIDLETRSDRSESEHFEEAYFAAAPRSYDPAVYAFFKTAVCCERLLSAFTGEERDQDDLMERSEKLFALSMRLIHGLHRPAVILYQRPKNATDGVDRRLAEIVGAELRTEDDSVPEYLHQKLPDDFLLRRLLAQCQQDLTEGKVVVLAVRNLHWVSREELEQTLSKIPCFRAIIASPDSIPESIDPRGIREAGSTLHVLNIPFLSDCFPTQEQAFLTLRELRFLSEKAA